MEEARRSTEFDPLVRALDLYVRKPSYRWTRSSNDDDFLSERDTPLRGTAGGPSRGSASRRYAPRNAVTLQVVIWALSVCLGLLLGSTWTHQILQASLQRQAQERRKLNEEWLLLHTARQRQSECPRCARRLPAHDWPHVSTLTENWPDER